jgi:replicative DNA helicase
MTENTIETTQHLAVFDNIQSILNQTLAEKYVKAHTNKAHDGINSGFYDLDRITKGFHPGELTTIVVRPGIGKTAFLLSLVDNVAITGDYSATH